MFASRTTFSVLIFLALLLTLFSACDATSTEEEPPLPSGALFDVLGEANRFETFPEAAGRTGLQSPIGGNGSATFFIPDDEAFHLMSPETLDGLVSQQGVLRRVLLRHVVQGSVSLEGLSDGDMLQTAEGTPLSVTVDDEGSVFLDGARVEERIGETNRGPVYRVKNVFRNHLTVEDRVGASPLLEHAARLFGAAGISLTQSGTFLIPVDPGFEQYPGGGLDGFDDPDNRPILRRTLRHLVIQDREISSDELVAEQTVATAVGVDLQSDERDGVVGLSSADAAFAGETVPLLVRDIEASNGVFHLIERPLQGHLSLWERMDFFDVLNTFAALMEGAGLQETLDGNEAHTVFAPIQAAFDSIKTRGVEQLMSTEEADLRLQLAEFHLSPDDIPSNAFEEGEEGSQFPSRSDEAIVVERHWIDPVTGVAMAAPTDVLDLPARNGRLHLMQSLMNPSIPGAEGKLISTLDTYDQLLLSGAAAFRAVVQNMGYEDFVRGPDPVSILAPLRIHNEYFQSGYECRAMELVEDHISPGGARVGGNGAMFMLNNHRVYFFDWNIDRAPPRIPATLFAPEDDPAPDPEPPDWVPPQPLGETPWFYGNFELANGSYIHGLVEQLRWYGPGPRHRIPRACT